MASICGVFRMLEEKNYPLRHCYNNEFLLINHEKYLVIFYTFYLLFSKHIIYCMSTCIVTDCYTISSTIFVKLIREILIHCHCILENYRESF